MAQVAVLVPAYDPGHYLREALDSLVAQTFGDWTAVVIDDGSHESLSWVDEVDPRIRRIRQDNQGLSAARNRGLAETTEPLVAFLDADDVWLPAKLKLQVREMQARPELGMLSTRFEIIDGEGVVTGPGFEGHHDSYESLLSGNGVCVSTAMVTRELLDRIGSFDVTLASVQDWDLWLRIARLAPVARLEEPLALYRVHAGGMSRNWRRTYEESRTVLLRHSGPEAEAGLRHVRRLAAYQALDVARAAHGRRDRAGALRELVAVGRLDPPLLVRSLLRR